MINLISWISFIVLYVFELHREIWLVRTFDYSKRYNSLHLVKYKNDYPELFSRLEKFNNQYFVIHNKEILRTINTLSYVINHMENELKAKCMYLDESEWETCHFVKSK
jgi:hypothetical protein